MRIEYSMIMGYVLLALIGIGCEDLEIVTTDQSKEIFRDIPLQNRVTAVQPMTGIVFWADSEHTNTNAIQLEYSYMDYSEIAGSEKNYDWRPVEKLLNKAAERGHQAILRFYYVYPGKSTTVPQFIKDNPLYEETNSKSEGQKTWFPDWSFKGLQDFTLNFYTQFAERYDDDPRLAFLQVGFGLWAEYHIYDGPMVLGKTFPSKSFQRTFFTTMAASFKALPWNISIDAADDDVTPFGGTPELLALKFGLFDDSFLHKTHHRYNAECFNFFDHKKRSQHSPIGGELSYYTQYDQEHALDSNGPYGVSFESSAATFHVSYMIGNDQPQYQPMSRIKQAGMATGYRFEVIEFRASERASDVIIKNNGVAPIYVDAFVAVNGVRSTESLKGLLPGATQRVGIPSGGASPRLTIECDRLVPGQNISFDADLI